MKFKDEISDIEPESVEDYIQHGHQGDWSPEDNSFSTSYLVRKEDK